MTLAEVREVEAGDKAASKRLRAGHWQQFTTSHPVVPAFGPVQPTRQELRDLLSDDMPLSLLVDPPVDVDVRTWVQFEAGYTTREPARAETSSFWHKRIWDSRVTSAF